ncbi:MAG TPA: HEAT repeat domain-containing protein [Planctomycetes bacterium]|nr:HEAT repeat domain-containing protein [Planctomycetota bacterium]
MFRVEWWIVLCVAAVLSCTKTTRPTVATSATAKLIADEGAPEKERLDAMDRLRAPVPQDVLEALLRVMKDRSQQAFLMVPDDSDLGYHTEENPFDGPDTRAELRWTAIIALERLGAVAALPDLISALWDRHPVVRNHAARALWKFGSAEGLPVLVQSLREKAFANETAHRILKEITGRDFGFDTDAGWTMKLEAIARWEKFLQQSPPKPPRPHPRAGEDANLDRRTRFLVAMMGQHQVLFMEQARRDLARMDGLALDHIEAAFRDPRMAGNQQLCASAVQVLEKLGGPRAFELLRGRLDDPSPAVRARAALALGKGRDRAASDKLAALLDDDDEGVVAAAVRALGGAGDPDKVLPRLKRVSQNPRSDRRLRRLAALSRLRLGDRSQWPVVRDILRGDDVDARVDAVEILREWLGDLPGLDADKPLTEAALRAVEEKVAGG